MHFYIDVTLGERHFDGFVDSDHKGVSSWRVVAEAMILALRAMEVISCSRDGCFGAPGTIFSDHSVAASPSPSSASECDGAVVRRQGN